MGLIFHTVGIPVVGEGLTLQADRYTALKTSVPSPAAAVP